jgi:hypothetical protein
VTTPSGPTEIMAAIARGMAGVANLSATTVSVNNWLVRNNPYSMIIFPSLGGSQTPATMPDGWDVVHKIKCKLTVRNNDIAQLHNNTATMIPLVLAWFRAHDDLGLADVMTSHAAPLTWQSPNGDQIYDDGGGVMSREIDFEVSVQVMI